MVDFFALGFIALAIVMAMFALLRGHLDGRRFAKVERERGVSLDPTSFDPVTLTGFDAARESLLVQLPSEQFDGLSSSDFATRASFDGCGQDLLFRDRVLLRLPEVAPKHRVDLFVEAVSR